MKTKILPPDQLKFLKFAETHKTVLNQILRQTTHLQLVNGPFSVLLDHTRVLDFDVKRRYFRTELERINFYMLKNKFEIYVRRGHVFEAKDKMQEDCCKSAKAIYDNKLLECYFTHNFYKHILGILVKHTDMESEDYSFYKELVYLTKHNISDLGYELTFSTEILLDRL
ncbi:E3 ubiquitin-protein ligase HUWE1-like [Cardiocondyla obscurior]|uniref:E3 ubiquitin-protein ligase HUWE1-like n=1 Tax=Cardiocondyla obscurior TaxID=286306 RepID=UPI0039656E0B